MLFKSLPLDPALLRALQELGFLHPTQIQQQAIPPALEGRDVLGCAATGSGKTAAFLLPILHQLVAQSRGTTRALVVTPTRELAGQILEHLDALATHTGITAAAIYGGVGMGPQERAFRQGVDVLVATPGRLLDHLKQPYASLAGVRHLVLDEADRMLDMGFLPDIKRILKQLPADRQTLFFSATMPGQILQLSRELLRDPVKIETDRVAQPARGITQAIYPVPQELKAELLIRILERGDMEEALVFTRTKHRANRLTEVLVARGIKAERIHGNRSQGRREAALDGFKNGAFRVLVATDVAARGIDVEALGHVVNFDVPAVAEDYIHRVGRTGRAEATGEAFTFVAPEEEPELRAIEKAIARRLPRVTVPDFDYQAKPAQPLEIPLADRIKEIRARKAEERKRAAEKAARRAGATESRAPARPAAPRDGAPAPRTRAAAPARTDSARTGSARGDGARGDGARPARGGEPRTSEPRGDARRDTPYADSGAARPRRRRGGRGRGSGGGGGARG
ncbi:MAG: DEAD/DEAH box helicase [Gemmatimonadaceae bacterium]|nr:DEAD/DEAH box helicase [Gemmatimonadaceae bacterium]